MRCGVSKHSRVIAGLVSGLILVIVAVPLNAQAAAHALHEEHPYYDAAKEVTLNGMVSNVLTKPSPGMMMGAHLLLKMGSGQLDASLGPWGFAGKDALSVTVGQEVVVTGVVKAVNNRQIFVVRTINSGGKLYTIRNRHGVPVSPQARERAAQKGVSL